MISVKKVSKNLAIILFKKLYLWKKVSFTRSRDTGWGIDFERHQVFYYKHMVFKNCYSLIHYKGQQKKDCVNGFVDYFDKKN